MIIVSLLGYRSVLMVNGLHGLHGLHGLFGLSIYALDFVSFGCRRSVNYYLCVEFRFCNFLLVFLLFGL